MNTGRVPAKRFLRPFLRARRVCPPNNNVRDGCARRSNAAFQRARGELHAMVAQARPHRPWRATASCCCNQRSRTRHRKSANRWRARTDHSRSAGSGHNRPQNEIGAAHSAISASAGHDKLPHHAISLRGGRNPNVDYGRIERR